MKKKAYRRIVSDVNDVVWCLLPNALDGGGMFSELHYHLKFGNKKNSSNERSTIFSRSIILSFVESVSNESEIRENNRRIQ